MDHATVIREKITEKYLLSELQPTVRDEFEEHFFDCPDCARDIRAASEFVEQSKVVLEEKVAWVPKPAPASQGWRAWFRPMLVVPVLAMLLAVIAYQRFVSLPQLTEAVNKPQILPAATVNLLTYGSNAAPLAARAGEGFLLNVIIPPDHRFTSYQVDLYNPAGTLESSVPVPASASNEDTWPIRFPGANRQSGTYRLKVHGTNTNGQDVEVGSGSFELRIQK
jgi:hypothetical protein